MVNLVNSLEEETQVNPGWINNGNLILHLYVFALSLVTRRLNKRQVQQGFFLKCKLMEYNVSKFEFSERKKR